MYSTENTAASHGKGLIHCIWVPEQLWSVVASALGSEMMAGFKEAFAAEASQGCI